MAKLPIPNNFIDNGIAALAIQLADPSPRLGNDGRFAIRLSNGGVPFLAKEGWNILAEDITIHQ